MPGHGTFVWNELMTSDVEGSKQFFTKLLGWSTESMSMPGMEYTLWKNGDQSVGGLMGMAPQVPAGTPPHWLSYVEVKDIQDIAKRTPELGGRVMHGPFPVSGVGQILIIADPAGAVLGFLQPER